MLVSSTGLLNLTVASVVSLDWASIREAMPQLCDHLPSWFSGGLCIDPLLLFS